MPCVGRRHPSAGRLRQLMSQRRRAASNGQDQGRRISSGSPPRNQFDLTWRQDRPLSHEQGDPQSTISGRSARPCRGEKSAKVPQDQLVLTWVDRENDANATVGARSLWQWRASSQVLESNASGNDVQDDGPRRGSRPGIGSGSPPRMATESSPRGTTRELRLGSLSWNAMDGNSHTTAKELRLGSPSRNDASRTAKELKVGNSSRNSKGLRSGSPVNTPLFPESGALANVQLRSGSPALRMLRWSAPKSLGPAGGQLMLGAS